MRTTAQRPFRRTVAMLLALVMFVSGGLQVASAGFVDSAVVSAEGRHATAQVTPEDMARIQEVLQSKVVRAKLTGLGFTSEEVQARLARLDRQELHELAEQIDEVETAGVHGLLLAVALVLLILILAGHL